uniref:Uncharacterized protein n=1 Tax=Mantoniella antarctica TaxID=81844 RepID=A0A7S0X583_9CHLO|mmetsp:Transcript_14493/g.35413  ORF Transcript_14493/g.35413 Transcript_14493/m.35413 type:complete len:148 (+) Transcript_14493:248-691(+)
MIPRSFWDANPRFLETYTDTDREQLRQFFDDASIRTTRFMHSLGHTPTASRELPSYHRAVWHLDDKLIPGVEIAEALATATKVEDLADAFAWFETAYPSDEAERLLQEIRNRVSSVHGDTMLQGSVPDPSRALNNEVACMVFFGFAP